MSVDSSFKKNVSERKLKIRQLLEEDGSLGTV